MSTKIIPSKINGIIQIPLLQSENESDWFYTAFWLSVGALHPGIILENILPGAKQAQKKIIYYLQQLGYKIHRQVYGLEVEKRLARSISLDMSENPDLIPLIAVLCCFSPGFSCITDERHPEVISSVSDMLVSLGADTSPMHDRLIIRGTNSLPGGIVNADKAGIAMAAVLAGTKCSEDVFIAHEQYIDEKYPMFWEDFARCNGQFIRK